MGGHGRVSDDADPGTGCSPRGAAVELADERGLAALTVRSLAEPLGVKPMPAYHHVTNKEEIVDVVFTQMELSEVGRLWRSRCGTCD